MGDKKIGSRLQGLMKGITRRSKKKHDNASTDGASTAVSVHQQESAKRDRESVKNVQESVKSVQEPVKSAQELAAGCCGRKDTASTNLSCCSWILLLADLSCCNSSLTLIKHVLPMSLLKSPFRNELKVLSWKKMVLSELGVLNGIVEIIFKFYNRTSSAKGRCKG
jgi:hypothetical protein